MSRDRTDLNAWVMTEPLFGLLLQRPILTILKLSTEHKSADINEIVNKRRSADPRNPARSAYVRLKRLNAYGTQKVGR